MNIESLRIVRLAGVDGPWEVAGLGAGVNLIHGPNGSGKSSLGRAIAALLYRESRPLGPLELGAELRVSGQQVRVHRTGNECHWTDLAGIPLEPPALPPYRYADAYVIGIDTLLAAGEPEARFAERIERELTGGIDPKALREGLQVGPRHAVALGRAAVEAETGLARVTREQRGLREQVDRLDALRDERREMVAQADYSGAIDAARDALVERRHRRECAQALERFAPWLDRVQGDEVQRLARLRERLDEVSDALASAIAGRDAARQRRDASGLAEIVPVVDDVSVTLMEAKTEDCARVQAVAAERQARMDAAQRRYRRANELLGDRADSRPTLRPEAVHRVEQLLGIRRRLQARREAIDAEVRLLGTEREPELPDLVLDEARVVPPSPLDASAGAERRKIHTTSIGARSPLLTSQGGIPQDGTPGFDAPGLDTAGLDALGLAQRALLDWLASPAPPGWCSRHPRSLGRWLVVGCGLGAGLAGALLADPSLLAFALGSALVVVLLAFADDREQLARQACQRRFEALDLAPTRWERQAVSVRVGELEQARRVALRQAENAAKVARLEVERRGLDRARGKAEASVRALARQMGFAPHHLDGSLSRWLRLVESLDEAERELIDATTHWEAARRDQDQADADLDAWLRRSGLEAAWTHLLARAEVTARASGGPGVSPGASPGIGACAATARCMSSTKMANRRISVRSIRALIDALTQAREACRELEKAAGEVERLRAQQDSLRSEVDEIYLRLGIQPGDDQTLNRGMEQVPAYLAARRAMSDAEATERQAMTRIAGDRQLGRWVEREDVAALAHAAAQASAAAERAEGLLETISQLDAALKAAQRGAALETAAWQRDETRRALEKARGQEVDTRLANLLLDALAEDHAHDAGLPALSWADEFFASFTRHRYRLRFASAAKASERTSSAARFQAVDQVTGTSLEPAELSVGTRMQLLLALRIACAKAVELPGEPMPLFVDEGLATADPARFAAMAQALTMLAEVDGRQVFYLTADAGDVERWRAAAGPARVIDLGGNDPRALTNHSEVQRSVLVPQDVPG